jgi:hypothetical protein
MLRDSRIASGERERLRAMSVTALAAALSYGEVQQGSRNAFATIPPMSTTAIITCIDDLLAPQGQMHLYLSW